MDRDGAGAWISLVAAVVATAAATWLVLVGRPREAGVAAGVACVSLTVASLVSRADGMRFLGAIAYRAFDVGVLSAIAWVGRTDAAVVTAALLALVGGTMAEYAAARGRSLGYRIEASTFNRFFRTAMVAAALLSGDGLWWLWALAVFSIATALVRASQVLKEELAS